MSNRMTTSMQPTPIYPAPLVDRITLHITARHYITHASLHGYSISMSMLCKTYSLTFGKLVTLTNSIFPQITLPFKKMV